jgi:hypothetical protein
MLLAELATAITGHSDSAHPAHAPRLGVDATAGHDRQNNVGARAERRIKQTEGDPAIKARWNSAANPQAPAHDRSGPQSHCVNEGVNITGFAAGGTCANRAP